MFRKTIKQYRKIPLKTFNSLFGLESDDIIISRNPKNPNYIRLEEYVYDDERKETKAVDITIERFKNLVGMPQGCELLDVEVDEVLEPKKNFWTTPKKKLVVVIVYEKSIMEEN